ncbi:uncharacterized protein LOC130723208 isoform X5 [Lotus japonicus]|uniref:uncharacterized protein LOC130723208 isoform X5 n=1 Tax=Lotus japonicus TaxID=34305 RepID=UPI0025876ACD|nr:uncharacterized protein LOC130723208 isoform X5 [Lotus japonicus]XP_057430156.1 uncharacterized protein LOC130723208 isoform X5 [Lotus japonicus]XP_057430157.1 uncharacterized protein LOC130723208 isoform X5 [Lotus japonicus]
MKHYMRLNKKTQNKERNDPKNTIKLESSVDHVFLSFFLAESDIESSLLSLSLKESSANRRSSSAYLNRRSSAAHANPGSSVKPRSVRPPSKKVPPPGSAVKPCASTVSVRPSRPPFRVLTPGSAVKPCSVSVRPSFRVCGRLPRNFPPPDILCTLTILHALVI